MLQKDFLKNKIYRQIKYNGTEYTFKRYGLDDYNQLSDEVTETFTFEGLFHETVKHIGLAESDGARIFNVPVSYILCLYEDGKAIKIDDQVEINEKVYRVTGKTDLNNLQIAYDISLELERNGKCET